MSELSESVSELGIVITLFIAMVCGVAYVLRRLFMEGGIIDRIVTRHITFLDSIETRNDALSKADATITNHCRESHQAIIELLQSSNDPNAPFSTVKLQEAAKDACDVLGEISDHLGILSKVERSLNSIRKTLG